MTQTIQFITGFLLGTLAAILNSTAAKPLKVFILAGQSHMQGHVNISIFLDLGPVSTRAARSAPGAQKQFPIFFSAHER